MSNIGNQLLCHGIGGGRRYHIYIHCLVLLFLRYKKVSDWQIFLVISLWVAQMMHLVMRKTGLNTVDAVYFFCNQKWNCFHYFSVSNTSFEKPGCSWTLKKWHLFLGHSSPYGIQRPQQASIETLKTWLFILAISRLWW